MAEQASILSSFPRCGRRERRQPGTCGRALSSQDSPCKSSNSPTARWAWHGRSYRRAGTAACWCSQHLKLLPSLFLLPKPAVSLPPQAGPGITPAPGAALTAGLPSPHLPTRKVLVNKASIPQPRVHQQLGAQLDYVQPDSPGHFSIKHQIKHRIPPASLPREVSLSPSL